jgi:hypothetical protein
MKGMNEKRMSVIKSLFCLLTLLMSSVLCASQYSDVVIADNPIVYWKLDQTDDGIAIDEIAGNNATFVGSVSNSSRHVPEDDGESVFLSGIRGNYIELPDTGLLDRQIFSLELWVSEWN